MPRRSLLCLAVLAAGCGDNLGAGPDLEITSPERGLIAEPTTVVVEGRAAGGIAGVFSVEVNGHRADLDDSGRFSVELELGRGTHRIETVAVSAGGGVTRDVRAVSLGPRAGATALPGGATFNIGSVGLGRVANTRLLPAVDMDSVYAAMTAGPIAEVAVADCPGTFDVIAFDEVSTPIAQVFLYGRLDGLGGELLFMPIEATLAADYPDSDCNPRSGTFGFATLELHVRFRIDATGSDGAFDIAISDQSRLYDHELMPAIGTIDADVFPRVSADIENHMADAMVPAGIDEYSTRFAAWLASFGRTQTAAVGGVPVEVLALPDQVTASSDGVSMALDLELARTADSSWVPTPETTVQPISRRAAVAVADDAVDQVLGAVWAGRGFAAALSGGETLEMLVPPAVSGDVLVIGDWIVDDEIALSGTVALEARNDELAVALVAGEVALEAQVLGADIDPAALEAMVAEAEAILGERITTALSALSMPLGESAAPTLGVTAESGYLVIDTVIVPPSDF